MTKYTVASRRGARSVAKQVDPIWRGIGCIMMLIIPVISYLLAVFVVNTAIEQNWAVPYQLMGHPVMPGELFQSPFASIAAFIEAQQNLYGILLMTVLFVVVIGGFISMLYAYIYRLVGPPRYGPLDAEQPRIAVKRYKR